MAVATRWANLHPSRTVELLDDLSNLHIFPTVEVRQGIGGSLATAGGKTLSPLDEGVVVADGSAEESARGDFELARETNVDHAREQRMMGPRLR